VDFLNYRIEIKYLSQVYMMHRI